MQLSSSSVPSILITPAPPVSALPDPYSPIPPVKLDAEEDAYRAKWLSVPPSALPWRSSPLRPPDSRAQKGLNRDQFNLLLSLSRDQRARLGKQKMPDLRRELAIRGQRLKQLERRALFLSKAEELSFSVPRELSLKSSMDSAGGTKGSTPEDVSPASLERLDEYAQDGLHHTKQPSTNPKSKSGHVPPSLDEITARLKPAHMPVRKGCTRLHYLKALRVPPHSAADQTKTMPVRSLSVNDEKFDIAFIRHVVSSRHLNSSRSDRELAPDTCTVGAGYQSRVETAQDMLRTLKRRSFRDCTAASIAAQRYCTSSAL